MSNDIESLVDQFADGILAQQAANDAETGNRHARRAGDAFKKLTRFGDEGRDALRRLLSVENPPVVRGTAATFLLRHRHDEAMVVLEELSQRRDLVGFRAKCSMKNWQTGDWQLDPGGVLE